MTEEQFKQDVEERWSRYDNHKNHSRIWVGFFLLIAGGLLLLKVMGAILFPWWFFTWPMILIAFGILSGLRHGFRGGVWIIMLFIGGLFLANEINPVLQLERYIGPIALIGIGLLFITRPKRKGWRKWRHYREVGIAPASDDTYHSFENEQSSQRDFLDVTAVFGGVKKNVLTKNFKGGDIVSFMGGSEIDFSQADFNGQVRIDVTNVFGGTKLILPPTWDVHNDITAIFGGVDDKRQLVGVTMDTNKVLVLDGTCMFGGIEIRSY